MKDIVIALLIVALVIVGSIAFKKSVDSASDTRIKAYVIDDLHYIIGFGKWDYFDSKKFIIKSVRGQTWEIYPEAKIEAFDVTPDFIPKQTK